MRSIALRLPILLWSPKTTHDFANSGVDDEGNVFSGWSLGNSRYASRVAEEHSKSAYLTNRAIDFLENTEADQPWCLHLSYIKPHWPLIAPSPYHQMYTEEDLKPACRLESERDNPHPVYQAFIQQEDSKNFSRDDVRNITLPVYMGLIKQLDDQLGRLFEYMKQKKLCENTLIVFTSDHGDYFGDHWLGEKDLLHDQSVKIPMIVVDPSANADTRRGTVCDKFIEAIDIAPTIVEFAGSKLNKEHLEGRSLRSLLHDQPESDWRSYAIAEIDYSDRGPRTLHGVPPYQCRAVMIRDKAWKYIHYDCFRPQLFDLKSDPEELYDLGTKPGFEHIDEMMRARLIKWQSQLKHRVGIPYDQLAGMGPKRNEAHGIFIGQW